MTDHLRGLSTDDLHAWYLRLADVIALRPVSGGAEPLASRLLRRYLTPAPTNPAYTFVAPAYVRSNSLVQAAIAYHRRVYLSRSEARIGGTMRIAGIQPRWCRPEDYAWDRRSVLTCTWSRW